MGKPYQIEAQRAVKRFESLGAGQFASNGLHGGLDGGSEAGP